MDGCIYGCQHPVWGGAGVCVENNDGDGVSGNIFCVCEDGYVSRDFTGAASCVSRGAQLKMLLTVAAISLASSMFLAWHAVGHLKLPASIRLSRRAKIRLRLSISTSVTSAWVTCLCSVGAIRTWTGYLLDTDILPIFSTVAGTTAAPATIFAIELWVDSLPSQVLAADSLEARLKQLAADKDLFVWTAVIFTGLLAAVNGIAILFLDSRMAWTVSNTIVTTNVVSTGSLIGVIGARISRLIGHAKARARPDSKAYYQRVRRKLWTQVAALCGSCATFSILMGAIELLPGARRTPIIPCMLCLLVSSVAFVLVVHFSRPKLASVQPLPISVAAYKGPPTGGGDDRGTNDGLASSIKRLTISLKSAGGGIPGVRPAWESRVSPSSSMT